MATFGQVIQAAIDGAQPPLTNTEHKQLLGSIKSLQRRVSALLRNGLADQAGLRVPLDDAENALRIARNKLDA